MTMQIKARDAFSFALLLKAAVGCSVGTLAIFGVAVPHFGFEPTGLDEGIAAGLGAVLGAALAIRG